jgi:hypothetical protein
MGTKLSEYTRESPRLTTPESAARRELLGHVYRHGLQRSDLRRKRELRP